MATFSIDAVMTRLIRYVIKVILCFCSFVWGLKEAQEPYVGEGVLCQLPPTLYKGGVIDIQHPSLLSGPDPSFFSKEHIIKTSPGWKTKFVVERLQLSGSITDSVEFKVYDNTEDKSASRVIYTASTKSLGREFTVTEERVDISIKFFGLNSQEPRKLRIRWISTPDVEPQMNLLTLDNIGKQDVILNKFSTNSILLNVVDDGGVEWQVNTSAGHVTLRPGAQAIPASTLLSLKPTDPKAIPTGLLLEWFPYVTSHHIANGGRGCLSYTNEVILTQSWVLKPYGKTTATSSMKIIFFQVKSHSGKFKLLLKINGIMYIKSTQTMTEATYYIPIKTDDEVTLELVTNVINTNFTLVMCYEQLSNVSDFFATGYFRSKKYPALIASGADSVTEGFPLPHNWSVTLTLETMGIELYRTWIDLILLNGDLQKYGLQTYSGPSESYANGQRYNRYPFKIHIWQNYCIDFQIFGGNVYQNEIAVQFQSVLGVGEPQFWTGYSIKWEARLQRENEGENTVYFSGDSGTISSPNYPNNYHSNQRVIYDIALSSTSHYNAIEFTFGDSYIEENGDTLTMWEHPDTRNIILINLPFWMKSGNLTGHTFTYIFTRVTMKFQTNLEREYKGFTMNWRGVYINRSALNVSAESTSQYASLASATTPEQVFVKSEYIQMDPLFVGWIGGLGATVLVLLVSLIMSLAVTLQYKRKLSDIQTDGFFRPKFNVSDEHDPVSNNAWT